MSEHSAADEIGSFRSISNEASRMLDGLEDASHSAGQELRQGPSRKREEIDVKTADEKLFNAAAMIYLGDRQAVILPSMSKSHIGNARITLRSADGHLLAHILVQKAKDALSSGRFGDLDSELSTLLKRRAEEKVREQSERDLKLLAIKAKVVSWLMIARGKPRLAAPTENSNHNKLIKPGAVLLGGVATVWGINFFSLQAPLNSVISSDDRNSGVKASASYQWMINPSVLVFSVDEASSASPADVSRILLQYAERLEGRKFSSVLLAQKGKPIFLLKGNYFKQLGEEYGVQNVIYTLRTMPENVYELDGSRAFSSWSGGWLGVMGEQFEDLNDFHRRWLVDMP